MSPIQREEVVSSFRLVASPFFFLSPPPSLANVAFEWRSRKGDTSFPLCVCSCAHVCVSVGEKEQRWVSNGNDSETHSGPARTRHQSIDDDDFLARRVD